MEFDEAFGIISQSIPYVAEKKYDGIIVKKIAETNCVGYSETSGQTHFAITGEQMNMFPYVRADGYFVVPYSQGNKLKNYFALNIPLHIYKRNVAYLNGNSSESTETTIMKICAIRSRRADDSEQIEFGVERFCIDGEIFINYKKLWHPNDYFILLKRQNEFSYDCFVIRQADGNSLDVLVSKFFFLPTSTQTKIDMQLDIINSNVENIETIFFNYMVAKNNSSSDKEKYPKALIKHIHEMSEEYKDDIKKHIFACLDSESFSKVSSIIQNEETFKEREARYTTGGTEYLAALNNYAKFLESDYYKNYFNHEEFSKRIVGMPLILYGPPGTGKTHKMQTEYCFAYKMHPEDLFITTFHQSFSYEEFVEGLKPFIQNGTQDVNYRVEPGIFYNACERAAVLAGYPSLDACISDTTESRKDIMNEAIKNKKIVLLCIDEINRANVSSVFGDLISLVESSKRLGADYEMTAKLPYSKKDFGVPANLMIIGTMNTADRSIQLLDSALRRRFKFEELLPQYDAITNTTAKSILKNINNRIRALLDKDHQIGHSYFIGVDSNLKILEVMKENIIPLLEEYFYNETDKIRRVLNETEELKDETSHKDDYFYVLDMDAKNAVKDTDDFNEEKPYYKLNENIKNVDEDNAGKILEHLEK